MQACLAISPHYRSHLSSSIYMCSDDLYKCQSGFHPVGEVGGKLPPQNTQLPPQKEREKKKRGEGERKRERERKKEREVHGGGRGACIFLCRIASDQYSLLLHDSII